VTGNADFIVLVTLFGAVVGASLGGSPEHRDAPILGFHQRAAATGCGGLR
jgi:hypothetical protein